MFFCVAATALSMSAPAPAPDPGQKVIQHRTLAAACDAYAKTLIEFLVAKGEQSIKVGRVTMEPRFGLATGMDVELELTTALEKARTGVVDSKARHEVRGDIAYLAVNNVTKPAEGDDGTQKLPVIKFRVTDTRTGKDMPEAARTFAVTFNAECARLLGVTVRLTADSPSNEKYKQFERAIDHPSALINKSRVRPDAESQYAFEVCVRKDGKLEPLLVEHDGGKPFVKLGKDDAFSVRFSNPTDGDVGTQLYYDGMDSYHFAERNAAGQPFARYNLVPTKKAASMMCWVRSRWKWEEFRVGEQESVEIPPARDSKWGSLTIVVMKMMPNPKPPPPLMGSVPLEFITIRLER